MSSFLLQLNRIRLAIAKRTGLSQKSGRTYAAWLAKGHIQHPLITFIVESHNKSLEVCHFLLSLRQTSDAEIIVIDDGSSLSHTRRLARELTGANEYLFRANDLYENITYDRCLHMATGQYVCLLQDDDDMPDATWVKRAVMLFQEHPRMVILGGYQGRDISFCLKDGEKAYEAVNSMQGDFSFCMSVNRAPMWVRRDLFLEHLRHIDYRFAPFQSDDYELCLRAWSCGLQVGWYDARFTSLSAGGMRLYNNAFTREMTRRNTPLLYDLYHDRTDSIRRKVAEANEKLSAS